MEPMMEQTVGREMIHGPLNSYAVNVWEGERGGATLYVTAPGAMVHVTMTADDLRALSAYLLSAADEVDALQEKAA